jgi:hypothetical protein
MNTTAKIVVALLTVGTTAFVVHATQAANAADKLAVDINNFKIKEILKKGGFIPVGVIYTIDIQINNPTSKELTISQLYINLSIKNKQGTLDRIANTSVPSAKEITIKASGQTILSHDIEIRFANVAGIIPNFIGYIINRLRGAKSTQQVLADISLDSMGLTIPSQEVINI